MGGLKVCLLCRRQLCGCKVGDEELYGCPPFFKEGTVLPAGKTGVVSKVSTHEGAARTHALILGYLTKKGIPQLLATREIHMKHLNAPNPPTAIRFLCDPRRIRLPLIKGFTIAQTTAQKLRPLRHSNVRIGLLRQKAPQFRMMPAQLMPAAVAMRADAGSYTPHGPSQ